MIIYKYCNEGGLEFLKEGRLLLSRPNSFNDPFEFAPKAVEFPDMSRERGLEMLRTDPDGWYERIGRFRGIPNKEAARAYIATHEEDIVDELLANAPKNANALKEGFLEHTSNRCAIGCFSRRYQSVLMWSHYANRHTGLIIGFDTDAAPFNNPKFLDLLEVKYSKERPVYIHRDDLEDFRKGFNLIAASKSNDWSYEEEVRIVVYLDKLDEIQGAYFLPMIPQSMVCVIYGCKCTPVFRMQAYHHLTQPVLAHVAIYEAKQHETEYKLDFIELRKGEQPTGVECAVNRQPGFFM